MIGLKIKKKQLNWHILAVRLFQIKKTTDNVVNRSFSPVGDYITQQISWAYNNNLFTNLPNGACLFLSYSKT